MPGPSASPLPVVLHILSASLYAILGAFQFVPGLRRRRRGWHRVAGWLLIPCGLAAGLSGLWSSLTTGKKVIGGTAIPRREALGFLKELVEMGRLKVVIDRCYPLEQYAHHTGPGIVFFH